MQYISLNAIIGIYCIGGVVLKKLIGFFIIALFLSFNTVSYAQIVKYFDSFDDSVKLYSYNEMGISGTQFNKLFYKNGEVVYSLLLSSDTNNKEDMYSKKDGSIKIDDNIFKVSVTNVYYHKFDYAKDLVELECTISTDLIDRIKVAKTASLRFYRENGSTNTIKLPDEVLAEWKQVIDMEK